MKTNDAPATRPGLGLYFEEFAIDQEWVSPGRTIGEGDLMAFAGLTGDFSPVHTNEEYGRQGLYGTRVAHGLLGLSIAQGLLYRLNYADGTGVASLGWDHWRFQRPIMIGDTLTARARIVAMRPSQSQPDMGIVTERVELLNQRGEEVQSGDHVFMVMRRPGGEATS